MSQLRACHPSPPTNYAPTKSSDQKTDGFVLSYQRQALPPSRNNSVSQIVRPLLPILDPANQDVERLLRKPPRYRTERQALTFLETLAAADRATFCAAARLPPWSIPRPRWSSTSHALHVLSYRICISWRAAVSWTINWESIVFNNRGSLDQANDWHTDLNQSTNIL